MDTLANPRAIISLSKAGTISGTTGCNRFSGTYTQTGERLQISKNLAVTRMYCDGLMEQERLILEALKHVRRFVVDSNALLLIGGTEDKPLMKLRRAED